MESRERNLVLVAYSVLRIVSTRLAGIRACLGGDKSRGLAARIQEI